MKLPPERIRRSTKAKEVLFRETEAPELDLKRLILERGRELQREFDNPPAAGDKSIRLDHSPTLADIIFIDQVCNEKILSPEAKTHRLQQLRQLELTLKTESSTHLRNGTLGSLAYGDWVQLFPEEQAVVQVDDDDLNKAVTFHGIVPMERVLLNLMQIRPDKRAEIASFLDVDRFEGVNWKDRQKFLENRGLFGGFLERLACLYLIKEDTRERFALSTAEKQQILRMIKELPSSQLPGVFRNALIVLLEGTVLKQNGQIEVRASPRLRGHISALPDRLQV